MRDHAIVKPSFWTGQTGRRIRAKGDDAIIVAMYLISAPNSNMIGLYYLPIPTIAHETGRSLEGASKALASLSEVGFAHYDAETETVWVPEMARIQIGESLEAKDNRCKAAYRQAMEHRKVPYFMAFVDRYWSLFSLPEPKPLASPLQAHSDPLPSQGKDQGVGQGKDQDPKNPPNAVAPVGRQATFFSDGKPTPPDEPPKKTRRKPRHEQLKPEQYKQRGLDGDRWKAAYCDASGTSVEDFGKWGKAWHPFSVQWFNRGIDNLLLAVKGAKSDPWYRGKGPASWLDNDAIIKGLNAAKGIAPVTPYPGQRQPQRTNPDPSDTQAARLRATANARAVEEARMQAMIDEETRKTGGQ